MILDWEATAAKCVWREDSEGQWDGKEEEAAQLAVSNRLAVVVIATLPTAWTPGNRRTVCLGCSCFWSGSVARRKEIRWTTELRGEADALLRAPGHSHMMESFHCRKPLWESRQSTIVTWCAIKLLGRVVNAEKASWERQQTGTSVFVYWELGRWC